MNVWGIDLGGTKIEGVVLDPAHPDAPLHRLRRPTEAAKGYDHVVAQIVGVVADLERASGISRPAVIGIGTPGVTSPESGKLKNSNTTCLNGRTLRADVAAALGIEVRMANDANCCALAEATLGAGRGFRVVMGLILGTGVGGGIVVDGRILEGRHGIAGEWGHNPICGETTTCYCGRIGCIETVISGPALERFYQSRRGEAAALRDIAGRAATGDADAVATIERLSGKFGEAIAAVLNILDPDVIVIGGGVGNIGVLYEERTRDAVRKHLFNDSLRTEFRRPELGDSAGVFGAAMLCRAA